MARWGWDPPLVLRDREQGVRGPEPWGAPLGSQLDGQVLEATGHGGHHDGDELAGGDGDGLPLTLLLDGQLGLEVVTIVLR